MFNRLLGSYRSASVTATAAAAGGILFHVAFNNGAAHSSDALHAPHYPWAHKGMLATYDHASLRRGFEVYKQVCGTCHGITRIAYRNLVGVTHTLEEAKALAEEVEYEDGPDDNGEMFKRPGKLSDYFQAPYPNENAARAANQGAYPPDLSLITKARPGGEDYIFALLTGYCEPPAGVEIREGLHYNPYFPGGAIGMARQLYDGMVDYADGTPNNASQLAKDVVEFLAWAAEPEMEERKLMGFRAMLILGAMLPIAWYYKRLKWSVLKSRKIVYKP